MSRFAEASSVGSPASPPGAAPLCADDLTGRDRFAWNVFTSWLGYAVYIAAGFIVPRLMSDRLGQVSVGIWDFCWSLVGYFALVQGGIIASINRFVAVHRAKGGLQQVNVVVSSVTCVLMIMAAITMILAIGTAALLPVLWGERLGSNLAASQWVVLLLGAGMAIQVAYAGYAGVITGFHRWDWHNGIYGVTYILTAIGMVSALFLGGGLVWLAAVSFAGDFFGRTARVFVAKRIFPQLVVRLRYADGSTARAMLCFGGKAFIPQIGELFLNQTISVLILGYLGPAALAIYSRPKSLVRHAATIVAKFGNVLTPTAGSLHANDDRGQLRELLVRSSRSAVFIALPMLLTTAILGDALLHVWMGQQYVATALTVILSIGFLATIVQQPVISILSGLNTHGRPGLANLVASIVAVGAAFVLVGWMGWGLVGAALAVTIPLTLANGVFVTLYACRVLEMPLGAYAAQVWSAPLLCAVPFAGILVLARVLFHARPGSGLLFAACAGSAVLAPMYWRMALPESLRCALLNRVGGWRAHKATTA